MAGGGGALLRVDDVGGTPADRLAQAELDVRAMGEVTARLVVEGDPGLRAGRRVGVRGLRASLDGVYVISEATHEIDATGYETVVSTGPPEPPPRRARDQVTLGVVDDVDDPEGRGRVRVLLPAYAGLSTPWAPVLVAAAGEGKGARRPAGHRRYRPGAAAGVRPRPRDRPRRSVRRGRAATTERDGPAEPTSPCTPVTASNCGSTRSARTLHLSDGHGSLVELGPDLLRITSATDLVIEAPGKALTVRAKTVDFEEAT